MAPNSESKNNNFVQPNPNKKTILAEAENLRKQVMEEMTPEECEAALEKLFYGKPL